MSNNIQRELIGSVELDKTKSGKPVVNLYSTDTRLAFPVLRLFDLSALLTVGIDPETLGTERVHRRFWAYWTESDKENAGGNRYHDIEYLEPLDQPATTTSVDNAPILAELRAIRELLTVIAGQPAVPPELDPSALRYGDGSLVGNIPAARDAFTAYEQTEGHPPASVEALRAWYRQNQNGG